MNDLVVLVADKNLEYAVRGLLQRPRALDIRSVSHDIFVHSQSGTVCLCRQRQY